MIHITESPREAFQANNNVIPLGLKVRYINALMKVGFDLVEVGSLVSPRLIPQLSDTLEVLEQIDFSQFRSKPMILLVNKKGADIISEFDEIGHVCYPLPVSESFAKLNLNSTMEECLGIVDHICNMATEKKKTFIVYISMAYGNPYGDDWSLDILAGWVEKLVTRGIRIIPLSNVSTEVDPEIIGRVFSEMISRFPGIDFGLHLHTQDAHWADKVEAAWNAGCRRFDGVMRGMGGCPMSGKKLLANLATENLVQFLHDKNELPDGFDHSAFREAGVLASEVFDSPISPGLSLGIPG
jgi:hydroxymethylglutaryl-CoA lyase